MAGAEPFEAQQLNYKDQQITYFDRGAAQDGRRPVLLIHGTSGTVQGHYGQIFPMLATNTRVIASDWAFPGSDSLELDELVDQQLAVLDATVGGEKVDVLGFSLGAVVAQALAARYPERVGALILVCGWASTDNHQKLRNGIWQTLYQEHSPALKEFMALCAFSPGFVRRQDPEVIGPAIQAIEINEFVRQQMELNARIDTTEEAGSITAPTLIVAGRDDLMVPRHHSQELFGLIENSRYTEFQSGHMVVLERPAELIHAAEIFFDDPESVPAGTEIPATNS